MRIHRKCATHFPLISIGTSHILPCGIPFILMLFPLFLFALEKDAIYIPDSPVIERTYTSSRGVIDTIGYPGTYGGQFIMNPGDGMLMTYKMPADGIIKGVNIPIYEWGTGDQELTISIHKLAYPNGADGTPYPLTTVDGNGWIGGYLSSDPKDSLCLFMSGTEYVSDWEGIAHNARDPLLAEEPHAGGPPGIPPQGYIWPWATAATMDTVTFSDFVNDGEIDHWISTEAYGESPKFEKDEWIGILVQSTGSGGGDDEATGFFYAEGAGVVDPWRFLKFYGGCASGTSGGGGWHIRHWLLLNELAVEFTGDRGPVFQDISPLYTTMSTEPRDVWAVVTDDNPSGGPSGINYVNLNYSLADSTYSEISMVYTDLDTFQAAIPAQVPGTTVHWYLEAADVMGNITRTISYRFTRIRRKDCLIILNYDAVDLSTCWPKDLFEVFDDCDCYKTTWAVDPAINFDKYTTIIEFTGSGPYINLSQTIHTWWNQGNKHYILTGDEWLGTHTGLVDREYAPGDFQYDVLGIKEVFNDINYVTTGDEDGISRLMPIKDDSISGPLYEFLEDSLFLNYDPKYELGLSNKLDGVIPKENVNIAFYAYAGVLDSADAPDPNTDIFPVGLYHKSTNGSKTVFFAFDPLAVNTAPNYHWVGIYPFGPLQQAFEWVQGDLSVELFDNTSLPQSFSLHQNFPNPFNPVTTIRYEMPKSSHVNLTVYDIHGREVTILVDRGQNPGLKQVQWNASSVPSGVYFIQIQAGDFRQVRKVMVLK